MSCATGVETFCSWGKVAAEQKLAERLLEAIGKVEFFETNISWNIYWQSLCTDEMLNFYSAMTGSCLFVLAVPVLVDPGWRSSCNRQLPPTLCFRSFAVYCGCWLAPAKKRGVLNIKPVKATSIQVKSLVSLPSFFGRVNHMSLDCLKLKLPRISFWSSCTVRQHRASRRGFSAANFWRRNGGSSGCPPSC